MIQYYQRFRDVLDRNRVVFETVAASLLSLMAIIVSIAQTHTASEQTALVALQTQIAEAKALPQFEVAILQIYNAATGKYDDNYLVVSNSGGPIHNLTADSVYFLNVTAAVGVQRDAEHFKAEVPVNGYFTMTSVSVAGTGELVHMIGYHNNESFTTLQRGVGQAREERKWAYASVEEQCVVRLRYRDLLDRDHEDYYEAHVVTGGTRMPDAIGKALFGRWKGPIGSNSRISQWTIC